MEMMEGGASMLGWRVDGRVDLRGELTGELSGEESWQDHQTDLLLPLLALSLKLQTAGKTNLEIINIYHKVGQ